MALTKRKLGRTGLEVTDLSYGAMEVRGSRIWGGRAVTEQQAEIILNAVLDSGINFIDTSNDYGRSEEFIGRYLHTRRGEYYLATKCGCTVVHKDENTDDTPHVWTRENLFRGLHESLERMKTDYIDVMQLHNPSVEQAEEGDLVSVLLEMKQQGKVRWVGCSATSPHIESYIKLGVFDVFQIPYSALERQHEDAITLAGEAGAGTIIRGGVARGEPGVGLGDGGRWTSFEKAGLDELRGGRVAHGVPAALHAVSSRDGHDHRGDLDPGAFAGERQDRRTRPPARRCLCRSQAPPERGGSLKGASR